MPNFISDVRSITGSTTVDNLLDGKTHEFLDRDSAITIFMTGSVPDAFVTFHAGSQLIIDAQEISDAARFPISPDDVVISDVGRAGDRMVLKVENRNAGANIIRTKIIVSPLGAG